jgi:DNA-binding SARP family transcriptional activator/tetratricopeptide (TPR) repeat protein
VLLVVLGPMALVGSAGERHGLGGPRQRLVLATLVGREGRAVTTDELVSAVWGDDPPGSAAATLQSYVSRLRRIIGTSTLVGDQGTYALQLPRADVDLWALLDAARALPAIESGDLARIAHSIQGPPYDDLTHESALAASVASASDAYLSVAAELARRLLDDDEPHQAEAVLVPAHERYQHDDEVARLIMLARARTGRPSEAVRAFRSLRAARHRRGLPEPDARTRQALEVIVAAHPGARAALTPMTGTPSSAHSDATSLPRPSTTLVGRRPDLDAVLALLQTNDWITVVGPPGVGKSRLAIEVGWRWVRHHAASCVYVDLTRSARDVLATLAAVLKVADEPATPRATTLRQVLASRGRTLLVLDGLEGCDDDQVHMLRGVVDGVAHVSTLATCHAALGTPWERGYRLEPLSLPGHSGDLLRSAAGRLLVERAREVSPGFTVRPSWDDHLVRITRLLDGLPLAIELVAAEVAHGSPQQVADLVQRGGATYAGLDMSIASARGPLSTPAQHALDRLSATSGWVPRSFALALAGTVESADPASAVDELTRRHLITAGDGAVRMPDVIRAHTRRTLEQSDRWHQAVTAHHRVLQTVLDDAHRLLHTPDQGVAAAAVLPLVDEIESAVLRRPRASACLVALAAPWLYRAGEHRRLTGWVDALADDPVPADASGVARSLAYASLAHASAEQHWSQAAALGDAAVARAATCDASTRRAVRLLRGDARTVLGDYEAARIDLERVLAENPRPCERVLAGLRLLRVRWASPDDARGEPAERARRALALDVERCADPALMAYHRLTLGSREQHDGRLRRARRHYLEALALLRDLDHRTFERVGALTMADLDAMQGRWDEAAQAAADLLAVGHGSAAGFPRHPQEVLARVYAERGDVESAHDALEQVVLGAEQRGHRALATVGRVQRAWLWQRDRPDLALRELGMASTDRLSAGLALDVATVRAACLVQAGHVDEATQVLGTTRHVAPQWPLLVERLRRSLVAACTALEVGRPEDAVRSLDDVDEAIGESGYVLRRYERDLLSRARHRLGGR